KNASPWRITALTRCRAKLAKAASISRSRGALRVELKRRLLEAFGIAPGEDDASTLGAGSPGGFQPDAGTAADDDDDLAEQFRLALGGYSSGGGGHDSSGAWCGRPVAKWDSYHLSNNSIRPGMTTENNCQGGSAELEPPFSKFVMPIPEKLES